VHLRVRSRACGACRSLRAFSGNPALNSHRAGNQSPFCRHYVRRLRYVIAYEYVITGRGHHLGCLFSPRRQHVCLIKAAVAPSTLHSLSRRRAPRFTPLSPSLSLSLSLFLSLSRNAQRNFLTPADRKDSTLSILRLPAGSCVVCECDAWLLQSTCKVPITPPRM